MWRDAVREWEMEMKGPEECDETSPASRNGIPAEQPWGQLAVMAGGALLSPGPTSETDPAGGCLKGALSLPTVKPLLQKRGLKTWATRKQLWDMEKRGLSGGCRASSFCQRMPPPSWAAASTSAAQSLVLCSNLQRHIFSSKFGPEDLLLSHFNSYFWSSHNFCFRVVAVSIISSPLPDERKSKSSAKLKSSKKKKSKWSFCNTTGIPCHICPGGLREFSRARWALAVLVTEDLLWSLLRF